MAPRRWRPRLARFAGVIFDMDGVLVDGEPMHFAAVNEVLAEEGLSMSFEDYRPHMGTKYGWQEMVADLGLKHPKDHYSALFRTMMTERYRDCSLPLPGAVPLVRSLEAAGVPIAVCSSSIVPWVDACLSKIGILDAFDAIITGTDVEHGKPAPDIYLLAAERLGIDPAACLAIEDAPAGIQSARKSGMTVWAVRTEYTRDLELPNADRILESLEDIAIEELIGVAA
ncbi:MAG: HAD family phosphatase [Dehalococcoidia bacterium]